MRSVRAFLVLAMFLGSCGEDDGVNSSAPAKCELLVAHFCTRVQNCGGGSLDSCVASQKTDLDCSKAVLVGSKYDTCIAQIDALPCNQLSALPVSCAGVIGVK